MIYLGCGDAIVEAERCPALDAWVDDDTWLLAHYRVDKWADEDLLSAIGLDCRAIVIDLCQNLDCCERVVDVYTFIVLRLAEVALRELADDILLVVVADIWKVDARSTINIKDA